ncbi:MAG: hypothetical protein JO326_09565, partial [Acetobacteraceae bacterium]|nr:hypothetical protein [Acetobacteraceae bacterium]
MSAARLKVFGWGREGEMMTEAEEAFALATYRRLLGEAPPDPVAVPALDAVVLRAPRLTPPASLASFCTTA